MSIDQAEIVREETASGGRYSYAQPGGVSELTYTKAGEARIVIDHTGVPKTLGGQGIAAALVGRAIADARREGRKIVPLCSYVAAQFRRHPEWEDVLAR